MYSTTKVIQVVPYFSWILLCVSNNLIFIFTDLYTPLSAEKSIYDGSLESYCEGDGKLACAKVVTLEIISISSFTVVWVGTAGLMYRSEWNTQRMDMCKVRCFGAESFQCRYGANSFIRETLTRAIMAGAKRYWRHFYGMRMESYQLKTILLEVECTGTMLSTESSLTWKMPKVGK